MIRVAACAVLVAGCINIHPYDNREPGDAGGTSDAIPPPTPGALGSIGDVHAQLDGAGGAYVSGPGYVLHFDSGRAHFPDSLVIAGQETLAPGTGCGQHAGNMGVQLYPVADSQFPSAADTSDLEIATMGPNVARVTINWTVQLGSCGTAHVDSWWTFFPDGRIGRYDTVGGNLAYMPGCGCGADPTLQLRNETRFKHEIAASIVTPGGGNQIPASDGGSNINDRLCFSSSAFKLLTVDGPGPQPLLYSEGSDIGLVYSYSEPVTALTGPLEGYYSVIIPALPSTSCASLQPTADGFAEYVELHVNGDTGNTDDYDGIAGGFQPNGDFGYTTDASDIFTFEVKNDGSGNRSPGPPGYAIGMLFATAYPSYKVERTTGGSTTTLDASAARVQSIGGSRAILWLRDGLAYTDVVKVTPQP